MYIYIYIYIYISLSLYIYIYIYMCVCVLVGDESERGSWTEQSRQLPSVQEIFRANVSTREFTHKGLRSYYRQEYGKLCARVAQFNRVDAWDSSAPPYGRGVADTTEMKRARVAWTELTMFAKCVLRVEKRGVRPAQQYARAKNRLERWMYGDRVGLWREVIQEDARRKSKLKSWQKLSGGAREARVNRLAGLKRVGKAVQAIISPALSDDTPKVEQKLRSKFHRGRHF